MYKKPVCDCGTELVWWSQPTYTVIYQINQNGQKSKRPLRMWYEGEEPFERLQCPECGTEYKIEYDEKGRILRGDVWEEIF